MKSALKTAHLSSNQFVDGDDHDRIAQTDSSAPFGRPPAYLEVPAAWLECHCMGAQNFVACELCVRGSLGAPLQERREGSV
jgi:hypothetical protein